MNKLSHHKFIFYLLILLTTFQSVDAIADAVKFHQPNSQYSEADYFNKSKLVDNLNQDVADTETSTNIDHCCYCHGVSSLVQSNSYLPFHANKFSENISSGKINYLSQLISPEHRPPIV